MHPHETRPLEVFVHPLGSALDDGFPAAFQPAPVNVRRQRGIEVVVEIKTAVESRSKGMTIENRRSNKGRGLIAVTSQDFRPGGNVRLERNPEVGYSMEAGISAGENAGV